MTVRTWVLARHRALGGWAWASAALSGIGLAATGLAVGLWLGRVGVYRAIPWLVLLGWVLAIAGLGAGWWLGRRLRAALVPERLAGAVEWGGGLRRGRVSAFATGTIRGSTALVEVADRALAVWLATHGAGALAPVVRRVRRDTSLAALVCAIGLGALASGGPTASDSRAAFWRPMATIARARGPVTVEADRLTVRRGETVAVVVRR